MFRPFLSTVLLLTTFSTALAQDYRVEKLTELPEADEVSSELRSQFSESGYRVIKGSSRTVCDIWLCKELKVDAEFEATEERLYPFAPGDLIGLLHFRRRGSEFRDQTVSSGWYTLRFELQPTDGNHEGTSPTRDFLLLVGAENDEVDKDWSQEDLMELSAEAAGSTHPAMLCLQRSSENASPSLIHDENNDWWILHVEGKGVDGDQEVKVPLDIVVVGHAHE